MAEAHAAARAATQAGGGRWFWPALLGILLLGGVARFFLRAQYLTDDPLSAYPVVDALTYWNWAGRIAAGQLGGSEPFFSAPLYPYLLGLVRAVGGGLATVYTLQILLDLTTAGLLAGIARMRFGAGTGLLAAALFLLLLGPASFCLRVLTCTLQLPLICLAWLALLAVQQRSSLWRGVLAGAALGLLALSYPPAIYGLPVFGIWWWWTTGRTRASLARAAVAVVAGGAIISPATIYNYRVSGAFFPVQSAIGINFHQGNAPGAEGTLTEIPGLSNDREHLFHAAQLDFRLRHGREGTWKEIDNWHRDQALAYWRENPLRTAGLFLRKAYWFLAGKNFGDIYWPALEENKGLLTRLRLFPLHTAWLIPPAVLAVLIWLRRARLHLPELLFIGLPLATVLVFWYSPRYRFPAVPVIVVGCAWALTRALQWRVRPGWSIAVAGLLALGVVLGPLNDAIGFDQLKPAFGAIFHHTLGSALAESGRTEEAIAQFHQALELDPGRVEAAGDLGNLLRQLGRPEEGLPHLERAWQADPHNAVTADQLARALLAAGRTDEALRYFRTAVQLDPQRAELRNNLGSALFQTGDQQGAREQFLAALRLNPAHVSAHVNLAWVLHLSGDDEHALQHLADAARLDPRSSLACVRTAQILRARGDLRGEINALRQAHQRAPDDFTIANDLAWSLATTPGLSPADRATAVPLAEQARTATHGADPVILDTLAAALAAAGRFPEAVQVSERAIALAEQQGAAALAESFRPRIELYRSAKPYVAPRTP